MYWHCLWVREQYSYGVRRMFSKYAFITKQYHYNHDVCKTIGL